MNSLRQCLMQREQFSILLSSDSQYIEFSSFCTAKSKVWECICDCETIAKHLDRNIFYDRNARYRRNLDENSCGTWQLDYAQLTFRYHCLWQHSTIMLFHLINPERLVTSENWFPRKGKFLIDCDQLKVIKLNAFIHFESNNNSLTHISVSKRIQRILMESIEFLNESIVKDFESQPKQCHFHPSPISTVLLNNKVTIYTLFTFPI